MKGDIISAKSILEEFDQMFVQARQAVASNNIDQIPELFLNKNQLPDGGSLYGMVFFR